MTPQPHITNPLDDARRLINAANHNAYRAGHMDTAYEIDKALKRLHAAVAILEKIQAEYPIANPAMIDTSKRPNDPSLAPEQENAE